MCRNEFQNIFGVSSDRSSFSLAALTTYFLVLTKKNQKSKLKTFSGWIFTELIIFVDHQLEMSYKTGTRNATPARGISSTVSLVQNH
jgi:hypothetical protein